MPVVAVNHVGVADMLGDFDGRAAKPAVTLGIVWKIAADAAVEAIAIKIGRVIDEEITHPAEHGTISDGGETEARSAHRNRDAGQDHGVSLGSTVAGQYHGDRVPEADCRFWQSLDHVREAASFGKGQPFR